jgi:hypothetical protein
MLRHKFSAVHVFGYWKKIGFSVGPSRNPLGQAEDPAGPIN